METDALMIRGGRFVYLFGWRRDSARRLPLRQTGLSLGGDLSPRWATRAGHTNVSAVLSKVTRKAA